ncbi:hypothetical protein B9Y56_05725 [Stenotrophomonas maltophilia]|nr:hypothetical protein B9Y56_05725 [Stenotrophomonas maltophilia]
MQEQILARIEMDTQTTWIFQSGAKSTNAGMTPSVNQLTNKQAPFRGLSFWIYPKPDFALKLLLLFFQLICKNTLAQHMPHVL